MKSALRFIGRLGVTAILVAAIILAALFTKTGNKVFAQATGYRFSPTGYVGVGQMGSICFEPFNNAGPDTCLIRLANPGQLGFSINGAASGGLGFLSAPPAVTINNAGSGGTVAAGTYRGAATYVTATGGETTISSDSGSTTAPSGGASTITITAPIAAAGAVGWAPYLSPAGGAANTEVSQPTMSATNVPLCTGAFQVFPVPSAYQASQSDRPARWVCPFGANWTITTQPLTAPTTVYSFTAQIGNQPGTSQTFNYIFGYPVPGQNSASMPAALPTEACDFAAQTALTSVTTAQTLLSCILQPGVQNIEGKEFEVSGELVYTSSAGTNAPVIAVTEGGQTLATITGTTQTGTTANSQLGFDFIVQTTLTGASGTTETHGWVEASAGAGLATAMGRVRDQVTAAATAFSLVPTNTLAVTISDTTSLTSVTLRHAKVVALN